MFMFYVNFKIHCFEVLLETIEYNLRGFLKGKTFVSIVVIILLCS